MRVLLVNPPRYDGIPVVREDRCEITERDSNIPPYSYLQLGSVLEREGHEVKLIDANGFSLDFHKIPRSEFLNADVLFFRFTPTTFRSDITVAKIAKEENPEILTIAACWTVRDQVESVLRKAPSIDVFCAGDILQSTLHIVAKYASLRPGTASPQQSDAKRIQWSLETKDLPLFPIDKIGIPLYDLLPTLDVYFSHVRQNSPYSILYFGKGCPYRCNFCTVANTRFSVRTPAEVVEELALLRDRFHLRSFSFFDETFTIHRKKVMELCELMVSAGLDLRWFCETRTDRIDPELLRHMRKAGCHGISLGIESGSQRILNNVKKDVTVEQNRKGVRMIKEAGIKVYANFIMGLPGETRETIEETIEFILETLPNGVQFNVAQPYPGTEFLRTASEQGWVPRGLDWEWLAQHEANIRTEGLNAQELEDLRVKAYRKILFNPRWIGTNLRWVLSHAGDLSLGSRYYLAALKNYLVHGMAHAH